MHLIIYQKSGEAEAECKAGDGWVQFEEDAELQRRRNATWRMMNLSCSSSPITPTVTSAAIPSTVGTVQFKPQDFINIFFEPYSPHHPTAAADGAQTLQLFPLRGRDEEEQSGAAAPHAATQVTPYQFFEFLPLKNSN